jgi:integrase
MSRPTRPCPSYLFHKPSGQARVRINGKDMYLGPYNSPESWQKYHRLLAEYATPQSRTVVLDTGEQLCVAALVAKYVEFARVHYNRNREHKYRIKAAISPLVELYGSTAVDDFTPKKLKAVRQHLVDSGHAKAARPLARSYVNQLIGVVKTILKWGVSEELVPVAVHQALQTVEGIRKGRDPKVAESKRVRPVPEEHISPVLDQASPEIRTMIQLQDLTGMRPDEFTIMRPCDICTSDKVWVYTIPGRFDGGSGTENGSKTDWREGFESKQVLLGPVAQRLLKPWLDKRKTHEYLFSPPEAAGWRGKLRRLSRAPRDHYDDESYCQAVQRACKRAKVPVWTPGRLRHNAATRIRKAYGLEAARLVLGHQHVSTREIYAERDTEKYRTIIEEVG